MRWAFLKCVGLTVLGGVIFTTQVSAWSPNTAPHFQTSEVKIFNQRPCPEVFKDISVSGEGSISACVMGNSTRIASYFSAQGLAAYAISFPLSDTFYRLDVCSGVWGCVYAEQGDTLVGLSNGYNHFAAHLVKTIQNGVIHYSPGDTAESFSFGRFGAVVLSVQSVAISHNGAWAVFEAKDYGIFRIDTKTFEVRRFSAPGFTYGYGYDPRVEMVVSNDGKIVGIVGLNMGLNLVAIDDTCGDRPNEFMQTRYAGAVTTCRYVPTPTDQYISNFSYALSPRLSEDDTIFSFNAFSNNSAPRHVSLFSNAPPESSSYVALGDSFSSGEGETSDQFYIGGATNKCHVSTRSYPFLLAHSWNMTGYSAACSGATIDAARGKGDQPNQLTELEHRSAQVVTIGIGGNDAGLIGKLKTCLGLDTCEWAETPAGRLATATEIQHLYPRLKDFYKDVKLRTSGAVIVVGYPRIIFSEGDCASPIGMLLNATERTFMNEAIHYLNQVMKAAASTAEVEFVDTEEALVGGELCTSIHPPFMNSIRLGDDFPDISALPFVKIIGVESFHPTPEGHVQIANKISQAFPHPDGLDLCETCTGSTPVPAPDTYWNSNTPPKNQRAVSFLKKVTIKKGGSFEISFPALSFAPSSEVVIELHSDVQKLGSAYAAEDGSFSMSAGGINAETGFHSVHALGKSFTGDDIDAYDFLAIEGEDVPTSSSNTLSIVSVVKTENKTKNDNQNSPAVLGTSTATPPQQKAETHTHPQNHTSTTQNPYHPWVVALIVLGILEILGLAGYILYQQKRPRYRGG